MEDYLLATHLSRSAVEVEEMMEIDPLVFLTCVALESHLAKIQHTRDKEEADL